MLIIILHEKTTWELEHEFASFVEFFNYRRYHKALENRIPADVFFCRKKELFDRRQQFKGRTLKQRPLHNGQAPVNV